MKRPALLATILLTAVCIACSPPSAADLVRKVMEQRNNYDVNMTSWIQRPDGSLYFDVMVVNNNQTALTKLTVMVEQLDADDNVLATGRVVMDVSALTAGLGQAIGVTLPNAAVGVEGARLFVESSPPKEAWPVFPELDAVRPRI